MKRFLLSCMPSALNGGIEYTRCMLAFFLILPCAIQASEGPACLIIMAYLKNESIQKNILSTVLQYHQETSGAFTLDKSATRHHLKSTDTEYTMLLSLSALNRDDLCAFIQCEVTKRTNYLITNVLTPLLMPIDCSNTDNFQLELQDENNDLTVTIRTLLIPDQKE